MQQDQFDVVVAIVYADISGSTALYEKVGNTQARTQIAACLGLLRDVISNHGGEFVHSRGDDVLCTFEGPANAFSAVKDMLSATANGDLNIHIGVDYGPAIRTLDDIFGDPVNVAARLADIANPKEALCSDALHACLSKEEQTLVRFFDTRQLRGKAEAERIYRFADFNQTMTTQVSFSKTDHSAIGAGRPTAYLSFLDQTVSCASGTQISIGRGTECDLTVPRQWVSRKHAIIEVRQKLAYVRDVSSNGTYVCLVGQPPILLRREEMALPSICTLSPTRNPDANDAVAITCHITAQAPANNG
jgi:adenylate cyclase